jgi:hypothetical protein
MTLTFALDCFDELETVRQGADGNSTPPDEPGLSFQGNLHRHCIDTRGTGSLHCCLRKACTCRSPARSPYMTLLLRSQTDTIRENSSLPLGRTSAPPLPDRITSRPAGCPVHKSKMERPVPGTEALSSMALLQLAIEDQR